MTVKVLLNSIEKVKNFSAILSKECVEGELVEGVHILDAKSVMGIFSLNLKEPLELRIHSDNQAILKELQEFIVEEN